MIVGISRRLFLSAIPFGLAAQVKQLPRKGKPLPAVGEFARIVDPVTENVVVRLTTMNSSNVLPYARNHFISSRERVLLFSSNRTGRFAPFHMDLRNGAVRQIAETRSINPGTLCFTRQEKSVLYLDGESLFEAPLGHGAPQPLGDGFAAFAVSPNGVLFLVAEGKLMRAEGGNPKTAKVLTDGVDEIWPQPNAQGCLFSRRPGPDCDFTYVSAEGSARPVLVASGRVREPFWDVDGESVLFLRDVTSPNGTILTEIHGRSVRGGDEYVVSGTSQFASFAPNSDASVFVGASRSHAQPYVVIMLRDPHREMTLCEHGAKQPADVRPVFSPDNRRVYFESDREGRPAIYSVNVELLVEPQP